MLHDIVYGWRNKSESAHTVAIARAELDRRDGLVVRDPDAWAAIAAAGHSVKA